MQLRGKTAGRSGLSGLKNAQTNQIQVSLSGCPGNEDEDGQILTLVTDKFKFRSSSYRVSNGTVSFADGELKDLVVVHKPAAAKPEETRRPKPDISGNSTK